MHACTQRTHTRMARNLKAVFLLMVLRSAESCPQCQLPGRLRRTNCVCAGEDLTAIGSIG